MPQTRQFTSPRQQAPTRLERAVLGSTERCSERERRLVLELVLRMDRKIMAVLTAARSLGLPDWRLTAGAIYQTVWNAMTDRPAGHGIKDYDLIYFDGSDLSYEAEDRVIRKAAKLFSTFDRPVEVRNQARVHLWYPERFGIPYPPLYCTEEALLRYASLTHAVAVRLEPDDRLDIVAPFGLANIFAMRLVPNPALEDARSYRVKAERMRARWPELEVMPWTAPEPMMSSQARGEPPAEKGLKSSDPVPLHPKDRTVGRKTSSVADERRAASARALRDWITIDTKPRTEFPR